MPITQAQIDEFARQHDLTKDEAQRDNLQRWFANHVETTAGNTTEQLRILQVAGQKAGVNDLNRHLSYFQTPVTSPLDKVEVSATLTEAQENAPWWRRATAKTLGALEWWQENAVEPSAAAALTAIFAATPGEQEFERRLDDTRQKLAQEKGVQERSLSFGDQLDAITDSYRKTNLPWGAKGFLEVVFDPLNVWGAGIPAKLAKTAPIIKPILFPLRAIDEAPQFVASKMLEVPGGLKFQGNKVLPGITDVPGIRALARPHFSTQVRESFQRTYSAVGELFGGATMADGTAEDTARVLSDIARFPQDTGSYSVRNIMNHLADVHGERAWTGRDGTGGILGRIKDLEPQDAASQIAQLVAAQESRAIRLGRFSLDTGKEIAGGGRRVSGEVVEQGSRSRRVQQFQSIFQKIDNDARWSKGLAEGADNYLHKFETFYLRKVEPNLIRPYALAHLAFAGFAPMNMLEDIGMSMIGLGSNPFGVTDDMWQIFASDLDAPAHLINAGGQATNTLDLALGKFTATEPGLAEKVGLALGGIFVKKSSEYGWAYRRSAWLNLYQKELPKALRNAGVPDAEIDALRTLVTTEMPQNLKAVEQDLGVMVWQAVTTGDPDKVRDIRRLASSARMVQKAQASLIPETANFPPAARDVLRKAIIREGGINATNADNVLNRIREELVEWHRVSTPEGIRASYKDFIQAIGQRPAVTTADAHAQLSLIQTGSDTLADMANEMRRNAFLRSENAPAPVRERIFREADELTDQMVQEVRVEFEQAVDRIRPQIEKILSDVEVARTPAQQQAVRRSINEMFDGYKAISENLRKTWSDHIETRRQLFADTPKDDRDSAFWFMVNQRGDELWESERAFRSREANRIREGWNGLVSTVKFSSLDPKNREIFKSGLQAQIGNAHQHYSELFDEITKLEATLPQLPVEQQASRTARINEAKRDLRVAAEHELSLQKELSEFGRTKNAVVPEELREYDTAIRTLRRQAKLAEQHGFDHQIEGINDQIAVLMEERAERFENFVPAFAKQRWASLKSQEKGLKAAIASASSDIERNALRSQRTRNLRDINKFRQQVERGEAAKFGEDFKQLTRQTIKAAANDVLARNLDVLPSTVDEMVVLLNNAADQGDVAAGEIVAAISENMVKADDVYESIYTAAASQVDSRALSDVDLFRLQEIANNPDTIPTSLTTKLTEEQFITAGPRLRNGRVRYELTDTGRAALENRSQGAVDIESIMAKLPEPERIFRSTIDGLLEESEDVVRRAVDVANNPPMRAADERAVGGYLDTVANHLENRPTLRGQFQAARKEAAGVTNQRYNEFFVNYDNRTTFDFIMQRMMPFWMYESRRWPRLIRLAGKRPILAKHMANVGLDWDYGYTPTPFGFEFNPVKGTLVGGLRRTMSRDFPELHNDFRGKTEQGLDWLGRGGFYFAPPFTAAFDIAQGEISNTLPPPLAMVLHGLAGGIGAAGGQIPQWMEGIAFNSRYTNFLTDQIISDRFGISPNDLRRGVENNDEDAIAKFNLARSEAAARMIVLTQTSVLRFRPSSKREFIEDTGEAIETFVGVSKEQQEEFRKLGIPLYSIIPVSGFQRRALREAIPNYDAWVASNIALRPIQEQRELQRIDEFWQNVERFQTAFEADSVDLNSKWLDGRMSGVQIREEYSKLQTARAAKFQDLKANPRFKDVPITIEERQAWAQKHSSVPPMVHPIDEILERYYAVTPEDHIDPFTGEPDFGAFFDAREQVLKDYEDTGLVPVAQNALQQGETDVERALKNASPWIREYFGIRDVLLKELAEKDPQSVNDYHVYKQLRVLAANATTRSEVLKLNKQARDILRASPELPMLERKVRSWRKQFRAGNPEMELVYQTWIARPTVLPGGTSPFGGQSSRGIGTIQTLDTLPKLRTLGG